MKMLRFLTFIPLSLAGFQIRAEESDSVAYNQLPELNIVALKQTDRLRSEPGSATILGTAQIENLDAEAIRNISEVVPNFYMPDYGSRVTSSIYLRGIGARMDNPAVGLTIDNLSIFNKDAYDLDIPDMASVEMLRGPQSALYGRNTMAGLINVATLSPFRFQGWKISVGAASGGVVKGSVGWYRKFSSKHALSISLSGYHQDGFFTNAYTGKKCDPENSGSLRIKYLWRPQSSLSLQNVLSGSMLGQGGYAYEHVESGRIAYNDPCHYDRRLLGDALTINKYHDRFTATSVTSLQYLDNDLRLDQDFLPLSYFTLDQRKKELVISQDLMVRSASSASSPYSWIGGLSGFWKRLRMEAPVVFKDVGISRLIESHRNEVNVTMPIAWGTREFPLDSDFTMPTFGLAAYHQSRLELGRWQLTATLRLEYERATLHYHSYLDTYYGIHSNPDRLPIDDPADVAAMPLVRNVNIHIDDRGTLSRDFLTLLPSVAILYSIGEEGSNLYFNFSRGAKAGGFNTQMFSDVLQQRLMKFMGIGSSYDIDRVVGYEPEKTWNYEVGTHLAFPSAGLTAEVAAFLIDCRDQQLTMFPDGLTTGRIMTNAGRTRSIGAEGSLNWKSTFGLEVNTSYGFTDARFRRFFDGKEDYRGKRLPYVPQNTIFLQGLYTFALNGGLGSRRGSNIILDLNMRATGAIYWNESNSLRQPLYFLLGASLCWQRPKWNLRLWGRNLTDTRYHTFYFMSIQNEFLQRGKPVEAGVTYTLEI